MLKSLEGKRAVMLAVIIAAVVATVGLLSVMQSDTDADYADIHVSGDGEFTDGYYELKLVFDDINKSDGTNFTITINNNLTLAESFEIKEGVNITLISSDSVHTLTAAPGERHFTVKGTLTLKNIILEGAAGGNVIDSGGSIYVDTTGSLIMESGAVIQKCSAVSGGAVYSLGTFTMNGGAIVNNSAVYDVNDNTSHNNGNGGGVYNYQSTAFTMNGGKISQNTADGSGGGVYNSQSSSFYMTDGKISGNKADNGGGVYNAGGCTFEMSGGLISGNTANRGGGVYNTGDTGFTIAFFTMSGDAEISGNNANGTNSYSNRGGGVWNGLYGEFTMEAGKINGNKSAFGAGVYNDATFTMNGGTISNSSAVSTHGAGVYNDAIFTMNGGTISGNSANHGAGVYNAATFAMNGGEISDNTASAAGGGIYNNATIAINSGTISGNSAHDGGGILNYNMFTMNGGTISGNTAMNGHGGGVQNNGSAGAMTAVFTMNGGTISGNTAMNGGGVSNTSTNYSIKAPAEFNMNGGTISGNTADRGGGLSNLDGAVINMSGKVEVSGNKAKYYGGGIFNYNYSTVIMNAGKVSDNKAALYGGGVFNWDGAVFDMSGGEISSNNALQGGGVANWANDPTTPATFSMSAGMISYNTAYYGGGMFNNTLASHDVVISSGNISHNVAIRGGGIYSESTLNVKGGEISYNTATGSSSIGSGGGIFVTKFSKLTVGDGVVFIGNTAPTLRTKDIPQNADIDGNGITDLNDYANIGKVVLNAPVDLMLNAPAYNNYDINYKGEAYVVTIIIKPNGGGTVTLKDSDTDEVYMIFTENGYFNVPAGVKTLTILEEPAIGYEFIQFTTGGVRIDDPTNVNVSGNIEITAEFSSTALPVSDECLITATSDKGSTISPNGVTKVPYGKNKTFTFSAKPGYQVTAVYVDNVAISSTLLASGKYTFTNVVSDHKIRVISEASGGGGGTGTDDPGTGIGDDGPGERTEAPIESGGGKWAVLNLVCAIVTVFAGIVALVAGRNRLRKEKDDGTEKSGDKVEDEREKSSAAFILRALALVIGIVSVIVFFLTEDWRLPVVPVDEWTLLMLVLFLATLVLAIGSFGYDEELEKEVEVEDKADS